MRESRRLTSAEVGKLTKVGRHAVGDGAYLQISKAGTKSWVLRYTRDGKARHMGLGPVGLVSLAEAREKAKQARRVLLEGDDPLDQRRRRRTKERLNAAKSVSFANCAERMISSHEAAWKNTKHRQQWRNTLQSYAYPVIGDVPVGDVDTGLVLRVLEPIWATKPETAGRIRGRIEAILDWAKARGYRTDENPARWRGHLDKLLPNHRKVQKIIHHPAMPYDQLGAFMVDLRSRTSTSAKALEFVILTAARTGEVIGAKWAELDLENGVWTVPAERMKAGREHRVPLSHRVRDILTNLPREGEFVFPGGRANKPLSNMALLQLMRGMRVGYVPHGFRSTFRDWAADKTSHPSEVVEMALAHAIESKTEAAYRRSDLFEKRKLLMQDWAAFCGYGAEVCR
jgi:integrase